MACWRKLDGAFFEGTKDKQYCWAMGGVAEGIGRPFVCWVLFVGVERMQERAYSRKFFDEMRAAILVSRWEIWVSRPASMVC
jgi:hypothetical protein